MEGKRENMKDGGKEREHEGGPRREALLGMTAGAPEGRVASAGTNQSECVRACALGRGNTTIAPSAMHTAQPALRRCPL